MSEYSSDSQEADPKLGQLDLYLTKASTISRRILNGNSFAISDEELLIEVLYPSLYDLYRKLPPTYTADEAEIILVKILYSRIRVYLELRESLFSIGQLARSQVAGVYKLVVTTLPPISQYVKGRLPPANGLFLAQAIGESQLPGLAQIRSDLQATLRKGTGQKESENLFQSVAFRKIFDMLDWENTEAINYNIKKILDSGIIVTNSSEVDLRGTTANLFNVSAFKTKNGYTPGCEIMRANGVQNLEALCANKIPKTKVISAERRDLSEKYTAENPSKEELVMAARDFENIERLMANLDINLVNGKWKIKAKLQDFRKKWLRLNGAKMKGGLKVVEIVTGAGMSQENVETCLKLIFGEDNMEFIPMLQGNNPINIMCSRDQVISACSSKANIERFKNCGISIEDDLIYLDCIIMDVINLLRLTIRAEDIKLKNLLKDMGLTSKSDGLKAFLAKVFPGKRIISARYKNGVKIERREEALNELREPHNMAVLLLLCKKDENGLIVVDLNILDLELPFVFIEGKEIGYKSLATKLNLEMTNDGIHELYCLVFGEEHVAPRQNKRREDSFGLRALNLLEVQSILSLNVNKEKLLSFTVPAQEPGKLKLVNELKLDDFDMFQTLQGGSGIGMERVLNALDLPVRRGSFVAVYKLIFGDQILEDDESYYSEVEARRVGRIKAKADQRRQTRRAEMVSELSTPTMRSKLEELVPCDSNGVFLFDQRNPKLFEHIERLTDGKMALRTIKTVIEAETASEALKKLYFEVFGAKRVQL